MTHHVPANKRVPTPEIIARVAGEEAERAGLHVADVLGADKRRVCCEARQRAWLRLVGPFSINGVASVWGYDRKSLQRVLRAHERRMAVLA